MTATLTCFRLLTHPAVRARSLALLNAGNSIAAKIPMMAITTSNSIKVNACFRPTGKQHPPD